MAKSASTCPQDAPGVQFKEDVAEETLIAKTHRRHLTMWRLFFAGVDSTTVDLATLRAEFLDCYRQPTEDQNKGLFRQTMGDHVRERAESRDFLKRRSVMPMWNNSMASYFLRCIVHAKSLDDDKHEMESNISMPNFLMPPGDDVAVYITWKKATQQEETEAIVGEQADKKTRLNTKSFLGGLQSEPAHIIVGIANFDAAASLVADYPDHTQAQQPLVVRQMGELANLFSSVDFDRFTQKYKSEGHIAHAMLVQAQMVFAQFARIASNTKYQNMVTLGQALPRSAYNDAIEQFESIMRSAKEAMHSSTLGVYKQIPRSYEPPSKPESQNNSRKRLSSDSRRKDNVDNKKERTNNDKTKELGWLVVTSGFLKFPTTLKKTPCLGFSRVGRYCRFNPCKFSHGMFPDDYDRADQKVICHFIDNAENAKFSPNVPDEKLTTARASPAVESTTAAAAATAHTTP